MVSFIVRRLLIGVLILILVTLLVFLVMRLLPGDPLTLYLAQSQVQTLTPEQMVEMRHEFGLDKTLPMQYIDWMSGVVHGDLGKSIFQNLEVSYMISKAMPTRKRRPSASLPGADALKLQCRVWPPRVRIGMSRSSDSRAPRKSSLTWLRKASAPSP